MFRDRVGCADFVSKSARFRFERADRELRAASAVAQVVAHKGLESAAAFALRDVDELVQEQFAVTPGIGPDNDPVADGHAARSLGDDLGAPGGLGELLVLRHRNPVDHQYSDTRTILNADELSIGDLLRL